MHKPTPVVVASGFLCHKMYVCENKKYSEIRRCSNIRYVHDHLLVYIFCSYVAENNAKILEINISNPKANFPNHRCFLVVAETEATTMLISKPAIEPDHEPV
jgi:hypothetical protein